MSGKLTEFAAHIADDLLYPMRIENGFPWSGENPREVGRAVETVRRLKEPAEQQRFPPRQWKCAIMAVQEVALLIKPEVTVQLDTGGAHGRPGVRAQAGQLFGMVHVRFLSKDGRSVDSLE